MSSAFIKAFSNFQQSVKGDINAEKKGEDVDEENDIDEEESKEGYSSCFINFREVFLWVYMYCCCIKYELLNSALVTMPDENKHDVSSTSRLMCSQYNSKKHDSLPLP